MEHKKMYQMFVKETVEIMRNTFTAVSSDQDGRPTRKETRLNFKRLNEVLEMLKSHPRFHGEFNKVEFVCDTVAQFITDVSKAVNREVTNGEFATKRTELLNALNAIPDLWESNKVIVFSLNMTYLDVKGTVLVTPGFELKEEGIDEKTEDGSAINGMAALKLIDEAVGVEENGEKYLVFQLPLIVPSDTVTHTFSFRKFFQSVIKEVLTIISNRDPSVNAEQIVKGFLETLDLLLIGKHPYSYILPTEEECNKYSTIRSYQPDYTCVFEFKIKVVNDDVDMENITHDIKLFMIDRESGRELEDGVTIYPYIPAPDIQNTSRMLQ